MYVYLIWSFKDAHVELFSSSNKLTPAAFSIATVLVFPLWKMYSLLDMSKHKFMLLFRGVVELIDKLINEWSDDYYSINKLLTIINLLINWLIDNYMEFIHRLRNRGDFSRNWCHRNYLGTVLFTECSRKIEFFHWFLESC